MIQSVLLLCCVLLSSVAAFPRNALKGALTSQPSFTESASSEHTVQPGSSLGSQDLHTAPSLAPLLRYLEALEKVGCLTEAHILQLQLFRKGVKDITETLIYEGKKHNEEEEIGNTKIISRDLGGSPGKLG